MIESSMYFGIGLLFGILIGLLLIPLAHARAVRLTARRLEAAVPELTAEVMADKDLLRAEFAMSTRRLEITSSCYWTRSPRRLSKDNIINRLKGDAPRIEVITPQGPSSRLGN
jgi:hypothetical protein